METMREELIFKEHCFAESEHNLTQEREHSTGLETEIQVCICVYLCVCQYYIIIHYIDAYVYLLLI